MKTTILKQNQLMRENDAEPLLVHYTQELEEVKYNLTQRLYDYETFLLLKSLEKDLSSLILNTEIYQSKIN